MSTPFTRVDELRVMLHVVEDLRVDVKIVDDEVGLSEASQAFKREESDIARTGPD